ncbi:MAG: hypothetical protein AAB556_01010 [Patescibacteria group bacterium]
MLKQFALIAMGQFVIYQVLFWIIDGGVERKIFGFQFQSLLAYTFCATFCGLLLTLFGGTLVNYALVAQALGHQQNLWYGQFIVWASGPILFAILSHFQRNIKLDARTVISLSLLFLAMLVRHVK